MWQLDVGALGYTAWRVHESEIESGASVGQLHFLSDHRMVVTFTSHVVPETLPRRGQPNVSSNLRLDALFVDADGGQVQAKRTWPTSSERSRILPIGGGRFVFITPDKLILYSSSIGPLKELGLPVGRQSVRTWWNAIPSPGGSFLFLWYDPPGGDWVHPPPTMSALISTEILRMALPWGPRGNSFIPFDDGQVITVNGYGHPEIGPPAGPWRALPSDWGPDCKPANVPIPVNDNAIFGGGPSPVGQSCYFLALTTGELVFKEKLSDNEYVGSIGVSAGGQRFAIETYKVHGGSRLLDIGGRALVCRIKVYDLPTRQWIFTLDGNKQRIKSISGLALSPNGSLLALIDQDGILQVYHLPPEQPARSPAPRQ